MLSIIFGIAAIVSMMFNNDNLTALMLLFVVLSCLKYYKIK